MRELRRSTRRLFSFLAWQIRVLYWGGAILVGIAAITFAMASEKANEFFAGGIAISPWLALILCPLGLVAVSWLTRRWFQGAQGSGIPQTLAALDAHPGSDFRGRVLSLRIGLGKILLTLLGLCSGASIGREGPTVHVGAAIMHYVGSLARMPGAHVERALILGGGAAGIAAAFNTPLAGVVFAIEELSRSFEERTSGILLTAVILSGVVAVALLGNYAYFGTVHVSMLKTTDWLAVPVCGVLGGTLGGLFSSTLIWGSRRLAPLQRARPLALATACGLAIAIVGLASGNLTYGTGYHEARQIVEGGTLNASFPFMKIIATVASYLSGIPGGIFAPSLAVGAGLGADFAPLLFPISPEVVVLLGMVGYFAGVVQTPMTAFVIVMEMTDNHGMLLPLMSTAFIAHAVSRLVCREPIYQALARAFLETPERRDRERIRQAEQTGTLP